ncbi:MAG: D-alanine--D-alanine ligase [Rhodospirillales bacterium]|nr:D-alanine--D-alanine ligase [Rhodospirillales bacterium]
MKPGADLALDRPARAAEPPSLSFFEFWPGWLFYAPILAQAALLALRYRSASLLTAANPRIVSGGLCGESKREILDLVDGPARALVARYATIRTGAGAGADLAAARAAMAAAGIAYPVVAKPDIGCNGAGVRRIADEAALGAYFARFPRGADVLLQEFVAAEHEAGLFYIRRPGAARGRISSITLKYPPFVVGDGRSTIRALVLADPRAGRVAQLYLPRLGARAAAVPAQGERVALVFVGNHCRGSIFRDGAAHATEALTDAVEQLARAIPEFHFGRFDVRFDSLAALRRGEGFRVIEVNGVGSEATHVWDSRTTLRAAWAAQFHHYAEAWRIGAAMRARGARPTGVIGLWRLWRRQKALMAAYPESD